MLGNRMEDMIQSLLGEPAPARAPVAKRQI